MDAEDYKEARELRAREPEEWFTEMRNAVNAAQEDKGITKIVPKCYLCDETENLVWCNRNPGFWLCMKHKCADKKPEIKIKDGAECPF